MFSGKGLKDRVGLDFTLFHLEGPTTAHAPGHLGTKLGQRPSDRKRRSSSILLAHSSGYLDSMPRWGADNVEYTFINIRLNVFENAYKTETFTWVLIQERRAEGA